MKVPYKVLSYSLILEFFNKSCMTSHLLQLSQSS